jgi:cupin superfamily acireductone dioxygenase involved in methionine salvage
VSIQITRMAGPNEEIVRGMFAAENCPHPRKWAGTSSETYDWHAHGYHKVLFCLSGTIVFQDREAMNYRLDPGDRLDIEPGIEHRAEAGPDGVECMESFR